MFFMINWDDQVYSVGIRKIDEQHKQLIGLLNVLDSNRESKDRGLIDKVFTTLVAYTQKHFADEVRFLEKCHYPDLAAHRLQHDKFVATVSNLKKQYDQQGGSPEILSQLTNLLGNWLTHHILVEDKAYSRYLEL